MHSTAPPARPPARLRPRPTHQSTAASTLKMLRCCWGKMPTAVMAALTPANSAASSTPPMRVQPLEAR